MATWESIYPIKAKAIMINIVSWYIVGILSSAMGIFSYEYFYLYDREIEYISSSEIKEDVLLSLLSWLIVLWLVISVILDIYMGWPSKGYDLNIKKDRCSKKDGLSED